MATIWLKYCIGLALIFVTNSHSASTLSMHTESEQNAASNISDVSTRMESSLWKNTDDPINGAGTVKNWSGNARIVDGKKATAGSPASHVMGRDVVATVISRNKLKSQVTVDSQWKEQFDSDEFRHEKNTQRKFQTRLYRPLRNWPTDASNDFSYLCIDKFGDQWRAVQHGMKKFARRIKKHTWHLVYRSYHGQHDTFLYCPSRTTEEKNRNVSLHSTPKADEPSVTVASFSQQVKYSSTTLDYDTKDGNRDAEASKGVRSNTTSLSDETIGVIRQPDSTNAISVTTNISVNEPIQLGENWTAIREGSTVIPDNDLHEPGYGKEDFQPFDDEHEPSRAEEEMKETGSKAGQIRNLIDDTGSPDLESLEAGEFADSESSNDTDLPDEDIDTFGKQEPITFLTLKGKVIEERDKEPVATIAAIPTLRENDQTNTDALFLIDSSTASSADKNNPMELLRFRKTYLEHTGSSDYSTSTAKTNNEGSKFDAFSTVLAILSGTSESSSTKNTDINLNEGDDTTIKDSRELEEQQRSASHCIDSTTSQFENTEGLQFNVTEFHRTHGSAETVRNCDPFRESKDDNFDFDEEIIDSPVEFMNSEEQDFGDDFGTTRIPYGENYEFDSWEDDDVDENDSRTITAKQPSLGLMNNRNDSASLNATFREISKFPENGEPREAMGTPTVDFGAVKRSGSTTATTVNSRRLLISLVKLGNDGAATRLVDHPPVGGLPEMIFGEIRDYSNVDRGRSEEETERS